MPRTQLSRPHPMGAFPLRVPCRSAARSAGLGAVLALAVLSGGCAYYNTFYHARKYFKEAEDVRLGKARVQTPAGGSTGGGAASVSEAFPERATPGEVQDRTARSTGSQATGAPASQLYDKAIEKGARVLAFYPKSRWVDDSLLLMGKAFYWKEDRARAARKFEELVANFPRSKLVEEAEYWHGRALWKMGSRSQARRLLGSLEGKGKSPFADDALLVLAEMAYEEGEYEQAAMLCQRVLTEFRKTDVRGETLLLLGKTRLALKRYDLAVDALGKAGARASAPALEYEARLLEARSLKEQGRCAEALSLLGKLAPRGDFADHAAEVGLEMADCAAGLGDTLAAREGYERVATEHPKAEQAAEAYYRLGYLYETQEKDLTAARSYYRKATAQPSGGDAAQRAAARADDLDRVVEHRQSLALFLAGRAHAAPAEADTAPSPAPPDRDAAGAPKDSASWNQAALRDSVPAAAPTLPIDPKTPSLLVQLAELLLFRFDEPDSALKYYGMVIEDFPEDTLAAKAQFALGWVQAEMLGDSLGARTSFERVLERYPETRYARSARARLGLLGGGLSAGGAQADAVSEEFGALEAMRLAGSDPHTYLPGLEQLAQDHPGSPYAPQAAYVAAWTYEHLLGDSTRAKEAYERLGAQFADTEYGAVALGKLALRVKGEQQAPGAGADTLAKDAGAPAVRGADTSAVGVTASTPQAAQDASEAPADTALAQPPAGTAGTDSIPAPAVASPDSMAAEPGTGFVEAPAREVPADSTAVPVAPAAGEADTLQQEAAP